MSAEARASRRPRPRVVFLQYTNPGAYPPLVHSAELLTRAGCKVLFLGMGSAHDPLRMPPNPAISVRLLRPPTAPVSTKLNYLAYLVWAVTSAVMARPAWIYVSDPIAAPVGLVLRWLTRARFVYHEHDSPDPRQAPKASKFQRLVLAARLRLSQRAELCVLPSESRAASFVQATGREDVHVVWNCPLGNEILAGEPRCHRDRLRVVYHGTIVPARVPETLLDALLSVPEASLTLIGYETQGHLGYLDVLRSRARALNVADRFDCRPPIERAALMEGGTEFDVGLSLLPIDTADHNESSMIGASNKPFDYLACGMALVVPDRPEWEATFVRPGLAISCRAEDANNIAAALTWLAEHPEERRAMARRGLAQVRSAWNYETTFAPVLREMTCQPGASATTTREVRRA